ncbi:MAG: matrixin family metalloprotease [Deltaproteobacteria bacterium]|nr:matrixin family metalloprotease [Deltaproteobacteria bacterium]
MRPALVWAVAALLLLCFPATGRAYKRSQVPGTDGSGPELYWCARELPFVINELGSQDAGAADSIEASRQSFFTWMGPSCTDLAFVDHGTTSRTDIGFDQNSSGNVNLVVWREETCARVVPRGDACLTAGGCNNIYNCWEQSPQTIALTTTTFNKSTGEIYDGDIELNGAGFVFTAGEGQTCENPPPRPATGCVATDVRNTVTHEIGHVIGLDHVTNPAEATMYPSAALGDVDKRSLHQDDIDGLCDVYPKGKKTAECLAKDPDIGIGDCGCAASGAPVAGLWAFLWLPLAGRRRRPS